MPVAIAVEFEKSFDVRLPIRQLADAELRPLVRRIDEQGYYPVGFLRKLGRAGAYSHHQSVNPGRTGINFYDAIVAMATVAEDCLSTAFCVWCQDALGWYLENTTNEALRASFQEKAAAGHILGGTGLSNPMKALSGIEAMHLRGRRVYGGWVVNGVLPRVSNLDEGHFFGICFEDEAVPQPMTMALARVGDPGVTGHPLMQFIAMEGTGTMRVVFQDAFVADQCVLDAPGGHMLRRIRPGFVLLQTGMGLGLVRSCLNGLLTLPKGATDFLPVPIGYIADRLQAVEAKVEKLARTPTEQDRGYLMEVLEARLEISGLALSAAHGGMLGAGSQGYMRGSGHHRRVREAYFLAMVTPSMRQIRKDLEALQADRGLTGTCAYELAKIDVGGSVGAGQRLAKGSSRAELSKK